MLWYEDVPITISSMPFVEATVMSAQSHKNTEDRAFQAGRMSLSDVRYWVDSACNDRFSGRMWLFSK